MEATEQAADECQPTTVQIATDAGAVPAPLPPRLHFDPVSGVLRVFYPGQDPEPDFSQQQAWAVDGSMSYPTQAYTQMGVPNLYYTAEAVATNSCSLCRRQFADGNAVLHHLRDSTVHRDTAEACEAAYVLQWQEQGSHVNGGYGYYNAAAGADAWIAYGGSFAPAAGWQPRFNTNSPSANYPSSMDIYTSDGDAAALAAPPSDAYSGSDASSDAMQQQQPHMASQYEHGKQGRRRRAAGRGKAMQPRQEPPKPEEYEAAFPPLSNAAVASPPSPPPKWGKPVRTSQQTTAKLRVDAQEYLPSTPLATTAPVHVDAAADKSTDTQSSTPSSQPHSSKTLRVDAPAWTPLAA